jgi:hypothetical protein
MWQCDRHERQTNRQQNLFEVGRLVKPAVENAFEHDAHRADDNRSNDEGWYEADAVRTRQRDDDIATGHGERAVRQVHEPHQPHRDREANGGNEEKHGIGQAVEENADGDIGDLRHEPHPVVVKTPPQLYARRRY